METPYIGASISLISKSEIRYEGILFTIDTKESNIALQNGARAGRGARGAGRTAVAVKLGGGRGAARREELAPGRHARLSANCAAQCGRLAPRAARATARKSRPAPRCTTTSSSAAATSRTCT
jgi:hypothetical protein